MGQLIQETMEYLRQRRENLIEGRVNCIPTPFPSFSQSFVGIERATYYCVTGNQKTAKSQFTSFLFLYTPVLYAYHNRDKVRVKVFYAPLEESKQKVVLRFMRYLLYTHSGFRTRVSHQELTSTREGHPISEEVLEILESEEYQDIMNFFEDRVEFLSDRNPTGIYKAMVKYADEHGKRLYKQVRTVNEFGEEQVVNKIVGYEPDDPDEYVIGITDHIGLLQEESGMDKRGTIKKYSEYMMEVRDYYGQIPVAVQQQNVEVQSMDAYKLNRIMPSPGSLADCKDTRYDVNVMLGLTNPHAAKLKEFLKYDITKLQDCQRFLEVMLARDGTANDVKALYFDGAVSYFKELPNPDAPNYNEYMERVYSKIENLKNTQ